MNREINLFVLFMSCVILGVSVLIGFKAYHDLETIQTPTNTDIIEKTTPTIIVATPKTAPTPITVSNQETTVITKPAINTQARIDQQKLYLVIAGGFQDVANAQNHQMQLKRLGYDAEIVRFKNSRLHVVCAGKFNKSSQANNLVHTLLQSHHIEAYVQVPI